MSNIGQHHWAVARLIQLSRDLLGLKTIKAVRFDENPRPCKVSDE
jgi:hypothetical protein